MFTTISRSTERQYFDSSKLLRHSVPHDLDSTTSTLSNRLTQYPRTDTFWIILLLESTTTGSLRSLQASRVLSVAPGFGAEGGDR